MYFLCLPTLVIGFSQPHYKVNESDCVRVCAEIFAGQLKPSDSVSFFITLGILGRSKLLITLCCLFTCLLFQQGKRSIGAAWNSLPFYFTRGFFLYHAGSDVVSPASSLHTFWESNMGEQLCKEIQTIEDDEVEEAERFNVILTFFEASGVQVLFNPSLTQVKIIDNDVPEPSPSPTLPPLPMPSPSP